MSGSTTLTSIGGIGLPTEPGLRASSSFGITMYAGPASVRPYEFDTDACGIRSCSCFSVAGASGALPIDTAIGAERSAASKRGLAVTSSAIAGTRKIIIGWSRSTTSNQWSTSNFGMYRPVSPIFIGL